MASSGAVARAERRQETTARPIDSAAHSPAGGLNTIMLCGKALVADGSGALYWPAERTLIVADLHLEKGSGAAARGTLLPPYDSKATLIKLAEAIDRHDPARVIALGDSLHDVRAAERLGPDSLEALAIMREGREWVWVAGNHDPEIPSVLGGRPATEVLLGGLTLRHEPSAGSVGYEICGHLHPAARLASHGTAIRRPCFVSNGRRLVMPAFGSFTGGLNVLDEAFAPLFGSDGVQVWMLGHDGAYPVAARRLRGD